MAASIGGGLTPGLKIALGAAGVGLVGGAVAERLLSPDSIQRSEAGSAWNKEHSRFLKEHPAPAGTRVFVNSEPAWKNAAVVGGAAAGLAALGGGLTFAASKMKPQNFPLAVAGIATAALGVAAMAGAGASWAIR
jgi:hypothetical protein